MHGGALSEMPARPRTLDELRQELDRIDSSLHDLIMNRAAVVEEVGHVKAAAGAGGAFFRPGREAAILRRLVARHSGPFPIAALARIWREIIPACLGIETPVSVAVYSDGSIDGYWDLARDQFGAAATYRAYGRVQDVVGAVRSGAASIGVVPMPAADGGDRWWPTLVNGAADLPRVVARLPFAPPAGTGSAGRSALVLAATDPDPSAEDRAYVAVETSGDVGRGVVDEGMRTVGFAGARMVARAEPAGKPVYLVEVDGLVPADDPRLAALAGGEVLRAMSLGGYAVPLAAAVEEAP